MTSPDRDGIKGILQVLEHLLDYDGRAQRCRQSANRGAATRQAFVDGHPHYDEQVRVFAAQREQMRDVIAHCWTLVEDRPQ